MKKIFKDYDKNQIKLPMDLDIIIPDNHVVKIVDNIVDSIDISKLLAVYKGGGTSAYHPGMLLKVIIYAYTQGIYSGRQIAKQLRENIYFMWISGKNKPDFRTLNRFRSSIMKDQIQIIFANVIGLLAQRGIVKLENCFIDGTKIEANANKFSFVWKKSTAHFDEKLKLKINALMEEIETQIEAENKIYGVHDLEEVEIGLLSIQ